MSSNWRDSPSTMDDFGGSTIRRISQLAQPRLGLVDKLASEMAEAWRRGERPLAEDYLRSHVELAQDPEAAVELIYEEICLRQETGEKADPTAIFHRFPQYERELQAVLACHALVAPPLGPKWPKVGETLHGFHLQRELGRGGMGRVFLAQESELGDRQVVLKLTAIQGQEHVSLARLQHAHIVPIHRAIDDPIREIRAFAMPYLGGTTLDQVLRRMPTRVSERSGADLALATDAAEVVAPQAYPRQGPARQFLERATYADAIAWIGACLADALSYLHARDLVHLDLKPSNVLLAADLQPLLLDFNLALPPIEPGPIHPPWFGGTESYMSPEQCEVLNSVSQGTPIRTVVDGRSDVFALGLVLYEALAGAPYSSPHLTNTRKAGTVVPAHASDARTSHAPLHTLNAGVSQGLSDIIARCLQERPEERYPTAAAVADDLRRHLANLPLAGVANRNASESWQKWRRRNPHAIGQYILVASVLVTCLTAIGIGAIAWNDARASATQALTAGREQLSAHDAAGAVRLFEQGLQALAGMPFVDPLRSELLAARAAARNQGLAGDLHTLADTLRFQDLAPPGQREAAAKLAVQCEKIWAAHDELIKLAQQTSDPRAAEEIREDTLDLVILWAHLARQAAQSEAERAAAMTALDQVELVAGPNLVLDEERRSLGRTVRAATASAAETQAQVQTAWQYYALGRIQLRQANPRRAQALFAAAIQKSPDQFWPYFYHAVASYRLRDYGTALDSLRTSIALKPEHAICYYNRGLVYAGMGKHAESLAEFSRALRLDPALAAAALQQANALLELERLSEASRALTQAASLGAPPAAVNYQHALIHLAQHDRASALRAVQKTLQADPTHAAARDLQQQLLSGQ